MLLTIGRFDNYWITSTNLLHFNQIYFQFIFNLLHLNKNERIFFLKYLFAGLEARKTKPGPGKRRAQARTGHTKIGFCPGPGFNFWHPVRSRVAPNPDRTRGFAKPTN